MSKLSYFVLLLALALGGLGIARAAADRAIQDDAELATSTPGRQSAAQVYINPRTGKLGGPPQGMEPPGLSIALHNKLSRSAAGLKKRRLSNGTLLVNLQGRFQNMSVVTLTPDQEKHINCHHSADAVEHALQHGSVTTP